MKNFITGALALLAAFAAPAMAEEETSKIKMGSSAIIAIAEEYLAAYSTFDMDKMAPFLADNMVFNDPTSMGQAPGGGAFHFDGKAAILENLGEFAATYNSFSLSYDVERRYESAGVVVFVAQLTFQGETKEGQQFAGTAPIVTSITLRDGRVVAHYDFFDYAGNAVDFGE